MTAIEDFDRMTDEDILDEGRELAKERLRKIIDQVAANRAPLNDVFGLWADGHAKALRKQVTWMWDDGNPTLRARRWLHSLLGDGWYDLVKEAKK